MSDEVMSGEEAAQAMADAVKARVRVVLRGSLRHLEEEQREELVKQVSLAATEECFVFLERVQPAPKGESEEADLPKAKSPHNDSGVT